MNEPLKWGPTYFFFPDNQDHILNGCSAQSCGGYTGEKINGLQCRKLISTYPNNQTTFPWIGEIKITNNDFNYTPVLVRMWSDLANDNTEYFYLVD
jgi:hypothetical protein